MIKKLLLRCLTGLYLTLFASSGTVVLSADGPGLTKNSYQSNELYKALSVINAPTGYGHGRAAMINGYFFVPFFLDKAPGGGFDFYDVSNPRLPKLVKRHFVLDPNAPNPTWGFREPHAFGHSSSYGGGRDIMVFQGTDGIEFWDFTDVTNPILISHMKLPGITVSHDYGGVWWVSFQAPYVYVGGNDQGLYIIEAWDVSKPVLKKRIPTSQLGGYNVGSTIAVGNLLVLSSTTVSNSGEAAFGGKYTLLDISSPLNPSVIRIYSGPTMPHAYNIMVNGNKVLVGGVGNFFHMMDITDPADMKVQGPSLDFGSPGGYIEIQDKYALVGFGKKTVKVDISGTSPKLFSSGTWKTTAKDDNFAVPLGNVVFASNDHPNGSAFIPHDTAMDNTGPSVNMVVPKDGAINQKRTTRIGLTFTDHIDHRTINTTNVKLRRLRDGATIGGKFSYQNNTINFRPGSQLEYGQTYEIIVKANGLKDWSGNRTPTEFKSRFTVLEESQSVPLTCVANRSPATLVGAPAVFTVKSSSGNGALEYSWDFGDGTPATGFSSSTSVMHTFLNAGHYSITLTVRDSTGATAGSSVPHLAHNPIPATPPTRANTIAFDSKASGGNIWVVNPDSDSVTAIRAANLTRRLEINVGKNPRTLAISPSYQIWVVNQDSATISVLNPGTGSIIRTIALPHASQPYGIAFAPNGSAAYVTLQATGRLLRINPSTYEITGDVPAVRYARGLAISADSQRIFVTRLISGSLGGEIKEIAASNLSLVRTMTLAKDTTSVDTERAGRGVPNYLTSITISPDGLRAWLPSKKDNTSRGLLRDGLPLTFENTVRPIISQLDLIQNTEVRAERADLNDQEMPFAVEFSKLGDLAFVIMQGTNTIQVFDAYDVGQLLATVTEVGLAPQGLTLSPNGTVLYTQNFMSRTMDVYDVSGVIDFTSNNITKLASVNTTTREKLTSQVKLGKQIFYNAIDRRMSRDAYMSCASCHLDGGTDGRVWDFSDRGEGLRRTIRLTGRSGMGHGRVHWTGNFDEIQDFENDIRNSFGGLGFMTDQQFNTGTRNQPLGDAKAGVSPSLDALAAYVSSLNQAKPSPYTNPDGSLTEAGLRGKAVFQRLDCASCHSGTQFTDSATGVLHNVGTLKSTSGSRLGQPLTGIDTPTLLGIWEEQFLLHDGQVKSIRDVLVKANQNGAHGATSTLTAQELDDLISYLNQLGGPLTP
jgi:YVTN family beta-propeller protein